MLWYNKNSGKKRIKAPELKRFKIKLTRTRVIENSADALEVSQPK